MKRLGRSKHRLVVNCDGGLGNQMFEYAAGLYFSRKFDGALEIVKPLPSRQLWNGYKRPFQLNHFYIQAKVREARLLDRLFFSESPRLKRWQSKLAGILRCELIKEPAAYLYHADLRRNPTKTTTYFIGYWQAASYVEAVEADLRTQFRLRVPMQNRNHQYAEQIRKLKNPVSVHVRIGDYALISHSVGTNGERVSNVLPFRYYERALAAVKGLLAEYTLVVFSDEQAKAKTLLQGIGHCIFIEGNNTDAAHEELFLMSLCQHHVIANSSFSWWGAWLNPRADKNIFAPRYWGNTSQSYFPDLYPPTWTIIDNL